MSDAIFQLTDNEVDRGYWVNADRSTRLCSSKR